MRLFRPVGVRELELVAESGWRAFPPRLAHQPIFYPVLSLEYATFIAREWNTRDEASGHAGFVTSFEVGDDFASAYDVHTVGRDARELWVPAEDLADLNANIVGAIAVVASYYGPGFSGAIDDCTGLPKGVSPPTPAAPSSTWRVPPYDRALAEIEAHVRATYSPLGIIVSGSIVRGEAGPTSDLDVFVVHEQPWRLREQRRFAGVPAELFVNPPSRVRRYFAYEHAAGKPATAHMFATGETLPPVEPPIEELVAEARDWLARPLATTSDQLDAQRYMAVDLLDDARDLVASDPAGAHLLLAEAVQAIVAHAFWKRHAFQPRRKVALAALARIDPEAAALVQRWSACASVESLPLVEELARQVLGVDTFFEWTSARDPA